MAWEPLLTAFPSNAGADGRFIALGTSGSSGSGIFKLQDPGTFSTAGFTGDYAFGFAGMVPFVATYPFSEVGRFHADGAGALSDGVVDMAVPGSVINSVSLAGTYAVP